MTGKHNKNDYSGDDDDFNGSNEMACPRIPFGLFIQGVNHTHNICGTGKQTDEKDNGHQRCASDNIKMGVFQKIQ